jgi:hypothetical protein
MDSETLDILKKNTKWNDGHSADVGCYCCVTFTNTSCSIF